LVLFPCLCLLRIMLHLLFVWSILMQGAWRICLLVNHNLFRGRILLLVWSIWILFWFVRYTMILLRWILLLVWSLVLCVFVFLAPCLYMWFVEVVVFVVLLVVLMVVVVGRIFLVFSLLFCLRVFVLMFLFVFGVRFLVGCWFWLVIFLHIVRLHRVLFFLVVWIVVLEQVQVLVLFECFVFLLSLVRSLGRSLLLFHFHIRILDIDFFLLFLFVVLVLVVGLVGLVWFRIFHRIRMLNRFLLHILDSLLLE